ncbi:MAG: amino acid ABC transporter substrate-binding protein [Ruminococcaceae bacterium]|nr:amino acid ABC transporter substrate-binding protein [Oscillospiraceae bacterium]
MKKILCMMLALVMMACMVACGGAQGDNSDDVIKIGGIGPLTGSYANYGTSVRNGAKIAVDEINAAGGIDGKQIELLFEDSQTDPESAVSAYGKLMDDGMDVSLGGVFSGETASITAAAVADDVLLLTPSGSADKAIEGNDKAFRVCFYDSYQGAAAANYIKDNEMATEVGVLYESDYDYSVGLYEAFVAECEKLDLSIVETQTFTTTTATDFSTQIDALVASGVKLVFMPIYAEEASTFLTQAKGKFASDVYFFGADGLDGILGKVEQDPSIADNVLMLTPFAADSEEANVKAFVEAYKKAYNATPDQFAADGYDAIYIIKAAIEAAGSTSGEELAKTMTTLEYTGVTGSMTWGADGNTVKNASAILYKDGVGSLFVK